MAEYRIQFRYNLGSGEQQVSLQHVNASDGVWHTVYVTRIDQGCVLKLDGGEGRYYNMTQGIAGGNFQILVNKRQIHAGGDVKFPSTDVPPIVTNDYRESELENVSVIFWGLQKRIIYNILVKFCCFRYICVSYE